MNPAISISIYLLAQLITILQARHLLKYSVVPGHSPAIRIACVVALLVYIPLALLPVGGAMLQDSRFKFAIQAAGNIWLGFYVYFSFFLLVCWLVLMTIRLFRGRESTPRVGGVMLAVCAAAGVVILCYGMIHAQRTIRTELDIPIEKDAGELKEMKMILIGDLHLSVNSHLKTIEKMVDMINEEDADVIVIAGDIFTSSYAGLRDPEKYAQVLRGLKSREGVYAVYGNHDVEETLFGGFPITPISQAFRTKEMEAFFKECGFTVLYDETVDLAGGAVQLVGRVDGEKAGDGTALRMSPQEVLSGVDTSKPVVVLQHEPVEFEALKKSGADLAVCGHTHAGQIFPGNLIVPFFNENAYGYKVLGGLDTVVTSGIGYYGPPMRVGTDSEVMVLNLHFGEV